MHTIWWLQEWTTREITAKSWKKRALLFLKPQTKPKKEAAQETALRQKPPTCRQRHLSLKRTLTRYRHLPSTRWNNGWLLATKDTVQRMTYLTHCVTDHRATLHSETQNDSEFEGTDGCTAVAAQRKQQPLRLRIGKEVWAPPCPSLKWSYSFSTTEKYHHLITPETPTDQHPSSKTHVYMRPAI